VVSGAVEGDSVDAGSEPSVVPTPSSDGSVASAVLVGIGSAPTELTLWSAAHADAATTASAAAAIAMPRERTREIAAITLGSVRVTCRAVPSR
jgi:hypothetical protein